MRSVNGSGVGVMQFGLGSHNYLGVCLVLLTTLRGCTFRSVGLDLGGDVVSPSEIVVWASVTPTREGNNKRSGALVLEL